MAEQTFKSPGFFEREIEIISRPGPQKRIVSAALIGPASKGPAFVPTYVSSYPEYVRLFGNPDRNRLVGHAASEYFKNNPQGALTICRVLGGGSNVSTSTEFKNSGTVPGAGFEISGSLFTTGGNIEKLKGGIHFIAGQHKIANSEHITFGVFNDNESFTTNMNADGVSEGSDNNVELIRGIIATHKGFTVKIGGSSVSSDTAYNTDVAALTSDEQFKIQISGSVSVNEPVEVHDYLVSLDPDSINYIENVLNTDPFKLEEKRHHLYAHFPVDTEVAKVTGSSPVAILTGNEDHYNDYGKFNTRFRTPKTTKFISQPFGSKEYDLFHFESLDDGAYANGKYKISISNLKASDDPNDKFGSFTVSLRDLKDTDESQIVYRSYSNCNLNPKSENFIAKVIGDKKISLNLDVNSDDEKRLIVDGTFENQSDFIRVVVSDDVLNEEIPPESLPFGFRGIPTIKTTVDGTDIALGSTNNSMISGSFGAGSPLSGSILPPIPYRFKVTKGDMRQPDNSFGQTYLGEPSTSESVNSQLHWGVMSNRVSNINNPNQLGDTSIFNKILENYSKFLGNEKSSIFTTGSLSDEFNNHKFSLAHVAFSGSSISPLTGSAVSDVFKKAIYVRNGNIEGSLWDNASQTINLGSSSDPVDSDSSNVRVTFAKVLSENVRLFNKFSPMAKFTNIMYGGFDGVNIFDKDSYYMTDRAASNDTGGKATTDGFPSALAGTDASTKMQGTGVNNNIVNSYRNAIRVMTEEMFINHNMLCIPGIRDDLVTDFAKDRIQDYGLSLLVMDIPYFDQDNTRLFVDSNGTSSGIPDADVTSSKFENRSLDSSYVATYFPDVFIDDAGDDENAATVSRRRIKVPASVAAFGALAISSKRPWFAPAGFERGALDRVRATEVRLNSADRDILYESRINPIASFPNSQFVIFGQKTTQIARTALDRVNVRRLMINIKRQISLIAQQLLFAQNDQVTRDKFINQATNFLSGVRLNEGIEDFRVIMDNTNNTDEDVDNNRLNGKIIVVPTRAIEFIAIDFIITNSGVEFPS